MKKIFSLAAAALLLLSSVACSPMGSPGAAAFAEGKKTDTASGRTVGNTLVMVSLTKADTKGPGTIAKSQASAEPDRPENHNGGGSTREAPGEEDIDQEATTEHPEAEQAGGETAAGGETPDEDNVISNLSRKLRGELDKSGNGMLFIYNPQRFQEIKAITRWTVLEQATGTQLLLVTKRKGSLVELSKAEFSADDGSVHPGEVIRDWQTTTDYEVIRILYTDPQGLPFLFVNVREPGGRVTVTELRGSPKENTDWQAFPYQE